MKLLLRHDRGELGPKTVEEWATPNGGDCLLIWMLKEIERHGGRAELVTVNDQPIEGVEPGLYIEELRP